ncbi:DUF4435 domain-containing protein [Pseudomonas sp. RGB]|uniref:DUF4435 domain-containing protein n=1 Tax=Pseudomonas sp. RGB TaxID=2598474 RepID=UPI00118F4186|nr:DUF4435 domain-containing protein [Pseudomonas sp. RGB]TVT92522.1 DUF4435 domain-containing protein [Pseudomonas sp. RGB]
MENLGFAFDADYVENQKFFMEDTDLPEVVVWVESPDDTKLWMPAFSEITKYQFSFKPASIFPANDDKNANGCSRLLGLVDSGDLILGKHQILCLDSDFKFISSFAEEYVCEYTERDNIYWTQVHSKENIYLNSILVDKIISHLVGIPATQLAQSTSIVLSKLSSAIYECYSKFLYLQSQSRPSTSAISQYKDEFIATFEHLKCKPTSEKVEFEGCVFWDKFRTDLNLLNEKLSDVISTEKIDDSFEKYSNNLIKAGISPENIHYFVRGHDLYSLINELSCKTIESYKKKAISEIVSLVTRNSSQNIKEYVGSMQPFGICLKAREPIFNGLTFFEKTLEHIKHTYK